MSSADGDIVVLGSDGFLGRNLSLSLRSRGHRCITIGRSAGDLRTRDVVTRLFQEMPRSTSCIFHLVTFQRTGQRQYEIPADLIDNNVQLHLNILDAWARYQPQAKLISTGSSCEYPEQSDPIKEEMFQSGRLHDSVRAYGLAKQVLAVGSEVYGTQYGLRWLHCILATMFGPFDHLEPDRSHFVGGMLTRAIREQLDARSTFTVWGRPDTVRECLYVEDQIEAILVANSRFENTIVNCGKTRRPLLMKSPTQFCVCSNGMLELAIRVERSKALQKRYLIARGF